MQRSAPLIACLLLAGTAPAFAQSEETPVKTFGYFQTAFQHQQSNIEGDTEHSFSVQQLNLLFQTDFSRQWRAFLDFEVLNNFSSSRRWGTFDLNEAWIRYRWNAQLTLRIGLQVPTFNRLNAIKNRTPLLPYVIRPLVYEESFGEFIAVEEFVPERAFVQATGFLPLGKAKLDYAAYVGNSPNINSQFDNERREIPRQTGVDTTTTFLVGGRLGVRYEELDLGVSATRESVNFFGTLEDPLNLPRASLAGVPRTRLGADFSLHLGRLLFEGEYITVRYDVDPPGALLPPRDGSRARIDLGRDFYYGTAGYHVTERLFAYGSYWFTEQAFRVQALDRNDGQDLDIRVPTAGVRLTLLQDGAGFDRITLKAQYAYARIKLRVEDTGQDNLVVGADEDQRLHFFALALSVLF